MFNSAKTELRGVDGSLHLPQTSKTELRGVDGSLHLPQTSKDFRILNSLMSPFLRLQKCERVAVLSVNISMYFCRNTTAFLNYIYSSMLPN